MISALDLDLNQDKQIVKKQPVDNNDVNKKNKNAKATELKTHSSSTSLKFTQLTERLKHRLQLASFKVFLGWENYSLPQVQRLWEQLEYTHIETRREMIMRNTEQVYKSVVEDHDCSFEPDLEHMNSHNHHHYSSSQQSSSYLHPYSQYSFHSSQNHSRRHSHFHSNCSHPDMDVDDTHHHDGLEWWDNDELVLGENKQDMLVKLRNGGGCDELWAPCYMEKRRSVSPLKMMNSARPRLFHDIVKNSDGSNMS